MLVIANRGERGDGMYPNIYREMASHGRMTMEQLSKELGMNSKTLYNKLNNKTQFNIDEMMKMQTLFDGVPLDELFMRTDKGA